MIKQLTDKEIVRLANALARRFYAIRGYRVKKGYRFDTATHPQERECWAMAAAAFEMLRDTDLDNALSGIEE